MDEWVVVHEPVQLGAIAGGGNGVHASAEALAGHQDVGLDAGTALVRVAPVFDGPHSASASETALYLIQDEQSTVSVTQCAKFGKIARRRDGHSQRGGDSLENDGRGVITHLRRQCRDVTERDLDKARGHWAKRSAVFGVARRQG